MKDFTANSLPFPRGLEWFYKNKVKGDPFYDEIFRAEKQYEETQQELIKDLLAIGIKIRSVYDLVNEREKSYSEAIPILLMHLDKEYDKRIIEGIVRALKVKEAKKLNIGIDLFLKSYRKGIDENDYSLMDASSQAIKMFAKKGDSDKIASILQLDAKIPEGAKKAIRKEILATFNKLGGQK